MSDRGRQFQAPAGVIAVCAPSGKDADMTVQTLLKEGFKARAYGGMAGLCAALEAGAEMGIVAEEVLAADATQLLAAVLQSLPSWSDPPIIVLGAPHREPSAKLMAYLGTLANITVVERPTRPLTLLAVVRAAMRARARQHETKDLLDELRASREEISRHRDELADAVRRRTEELQSVNAALRLSERMAAIGTLSAGIGHDIANLLLPVRVHIDALEQNAGPLANGKSSISDHIPAIRACIGHLQRLSAGLRQMALDPEDVSAAGPGTEDTDLTEWWQTAEPVIRNTLPKGVRLEADIGPGLRASIAPHQLSQAIVNLVQNAGDAIASKAGKPSGRVLVWARPGREGAAPMLGHQQPAMWGAWPGEDRVRIGVTDDGPGMSEDVRRRCLEPLFTTKTRRLSTGLGLVLVKGIVQRAGGELQLLSDNVEGPARGTTFILCLPVPAAARASRPKAAVTVRDPRFRGFISSTLKSLGYEPEPYAAELLSATTAAALSTSARLRTAPGTAVLPAPSPQVAHIDPAALGDAEIWITDPEVTTPGDLRRFAAGSAGRRVLVLGPGRLDDSASTPSDDLRDRVIDFPHRPGPTQVREALSNLCSR